MNKEIQSTGDGNQCCAKGGERSKNGTGRAATVVQSGLLGDSLTVRVTEKLEGGSS